jgi:hypothetical protein
MLSIGFPLILYSVSFSRPIYMKSKVMTKDVIIPNVKSNSAPTIAGITVAVNNTIKVLKSGMSFIKNPFKLKKHLGADDSF